MAKVLETTGMVCPFPLVEAKETIVDMSKGEELIINLDCTQATESIPRWAATEGHETWSLSKSMTLNGVSSSKREIKLIQRKRARVPVYVFRIFQG